MQKNCKIFQLIVKKRQLPDTKSRKPALYKKSAENI